MTSTEAGWITNALSLGEREGARLQDGKIAPTPSTLAQSKERKGSNFAAQRSGAIVQKPEGPNTYDLRYGFSHLATMGGSCDADISLFSCPVSVRSSWSVLPSWQREKVVVSMVHKDCLYMMELSSGTFLVIL